MEDLLTPQICMDVDPTPLQMVDVEVSSESSESEKRLEGNGEEVDPHIAKSSDQIPNDLSFEELKFKSELFSMGQLQVQFMRIHCTACNGHLGSAPNGQCNRYIHPLLKVFLCKACYMFYTSGDFEKDEDGSELYCRWCGQGGKVMCCAQCAFVFCQKCIRQNLGKKKVDAVKESDDWLCFSCDPGQLIKMRVVCYCMYEYVQNEVRISGELNTPERLKVDASLCCPRKRKIKLDFPYNINNDVGEQMTKKIYKSHASPAANTSYSEVDSILNFQEKDEVVCTPDLLSLISEDQTTKSPTSKLNPDEALLCLPNFPHIKKIVKFTQARPNIFPKFSVKPNLMKRNPVSFAKKQQTQGYVYQPNNIPSGGNLANTMKLNLKYVVNQAETSRRVNTSPPPLSPSYGSQLDWFEKAAQQTAQINGRLSTEIVQLSVEQKMALSVTELADIHNKLQELLSSSVNNLIQVRKCLRNEFLADVSTYTSTNKFVLPENSNHDIICVDADAFNIRNECLNSVTTTVNYENKIQIPRLKVKSVSELANIPAECITIPDEPEVHIVIDDEDDSLPKITTEETTQLEESKSEESIQDFDPDTAKLIKQALLESKFDQLVESNMGVEVQDVSKEKLKQMLSVRVVLETDFAPGTPRRHPKKHFKPMEIIEPQDIEEMLSGSILSKNATVPLITSDTQDIEELLGGSILVKHNTVTQNAFGDAFSQFIAKNKVYKSDSEGMIVDEEENGIKTGVGNDLCNEQSASANNSKSANDDNSERGFESENNAENVSDNNKLVNVLNELTDNFKNISEQL